MKGYIYIIKNTINNKVYIGQTSRTIQARFQQHLNAAKRGDTEGMIIYNAIRKYGAENFYIEELEYVEVELLNERERYWIQYYDSLRPNGYNVREGGDDCGRKEVFQIDINTNEIINTFPSVTAAAEQCNLDLSHLSKTCRHEKGYQSCGGFKWSYIYNYSPEYISSLNPKVSERPVCQIDDNTGNIIKVWDNMQQASLALNISSGSISNCISGKYKTAGGFQWRNIDDLSNIKPHNREKAVYQYDKQNNLIKKWDSAKQAAEFLNKEPSTIRSAARGARKTAYGYKWRYDDIND